MARPSVRTHAFAGLFSRAFSTAQTQRTKLKEELLAYIEPLDRGVAATPEQQQEVDRLASALERLNPNPKTLESDLISGKWRLLYTTSASILGSSRPPFLRPFGAIYQTIDRDQLKARNDETAPFFNAVTADLTPADSKKVKVKFSKFFLFGGLFSFTAPDSARGELTITYLDEDMRISRGDKGNLFVLDMADPDARL